MATENRDIKYLSKDFSDFRSSLIDFTKTYFPSTYNDFTPSSPGMLFMEMSAYVGDILSFYLDNQIQENFIQFTRQTNNLYTLAYMLGYKPKVTAAATVDIDVYQQIPSLLVNGEYVPDYTYALYVNKNLNINSNLVGGFSFLTQDDIDFSYSSSSDPTEISIYSVNTSTNIPDFYLLKKTRKAISAEIKSTTFSFNSPERFQTVEINDSNIIQILDIVDSDGNEWYEVPYLAQETVFNTIKNTNPNDPNNYQEAGEVPYLLQLRKVPRRFVTRFTTPTTLQLQFGAGTNTQNNDEEIIPNTDNIGLGLPYKRSLLTTGFAPANFLYTDTYGISPYNTTLTVRYLRGGGVASNSPANSINILNNKEGIVFQNNNLDPVIAQTVFDSVAVNNASAAAGGQDGDTPDEIRFNTLSTFATQLRTVTQDDYLVRALSLPSQYGSISKVYIEPQKLENILPGETPSVLNLYVLAFDNNKKLKQASNALKQNLATYLSQYRVINDSIKIKDAFVINIGIEFDITVLPEYNNNEVLIACIQAVKDYFQIDKWQINEPILLKDLLILIDKIDGVQTVKNVSVSNKVGENLGYSKYAYDIKGAIINNVVYPSLDPMVFEVKYPDTDIKGRVVPL
jgi:hypothetical protein